MRAGDRVFLVLVGFVLAIMAFVLVASARQETQTFDEAVYLAAGYSYWETGDYRLNHEHPPLAKLLCAIPLLGLDLRLPLDDPFWKQADAVGFGARFLYENRAPADDILFRGRSVTIALTLAFGLVLALWVRRRGGIWAALVAVTLFAFDPNVIAHGRYTTNDLAVALFFFLACVVWDRALRRGAPADYAMAGVALGCALCTKFSALILLPIILILTIVRRPKMRPFAVGSLVAGAIVVAIVEALYRGAGSLYVEGLRSVMSIGHTSYLLGHESTTGWWYYFPVAFAVKTPVAVLLLTGAVAIFALRRPSRVPDIAVLAIPVVVYAAFCLVSRDDIGIRYLLPVYPMLYAIIALVVTRLATRLATRAAIAGCLLLTVLESASVYPNYLAFFNAFAGGPAEGPRYLLDSNVDWGQDLEKMKRWLDARAIDHVCIEYFGTASLLYYGITYTSVPTYRERSLIQRLDCMVAASVTYLYGRALISGDALRWLRTASPVAKIGYSIYMFDCRRRTSDDAMRSCPRDEGAHAP